MFAEALYRQHVTFVGTTRIVMQGFDVNENVFINEALVYWLQFAFCWLNLPSQTHFTSVYIRFHGFIDAYSPVPLEECVDCLLYTAVSERVMHVEEKTLHELRRNYDEVFGEICAEDPTPVQNPMLE